MTIDEKLVDELAHLARLKFEDEARTEIMNDLNRMLSFVEKLNEVNTDQVEPLIYMTNDVNILRRDEVVESTTHEEALRNAPAKDSDYFRVPKVIG
ncbi:MAG: Asp-tRNA(Asn)/Glu-tRNA(Gln) amidotransferase subunit GatC [Bacteroidetes bacterium]|nr:Asp-tRNA(Asn)/Glu-tRNA(Gln) amidotransferase subunit GatC [Bacteroidota bacterium]